MNNKSIFHHIHNYVCILLITISICCCTHKSGDDALAIFSIPCEAKFEVGDIAISRDIPAAPGSDKIHKNKLRDNLETILKKYNINNVKFQLVCNMESYFNFTLTHCFISIATSVIPPDGKALGATHTNVSIPTFQTLSIQVINAA